MIAFLPF